MIFARRAAVAAVAIALVFGLLSAAASAETCGLMKYAGFDISGNDSAVVIPVSVEGTAESFLVDTGGMASTLLQPSADALGLPAHVITSGLEFYGADGALMNRYVRVERLGIGPLRLSHVQLLLMPGNLVKSDRIAGTLAPDILRNFDLDFDFGAKTLNLFSPDHCKGKVVYWAASYGTVPFQMGDREHIEMPVTLDGHRFTAELDTGSTYSSINSTIASSAFGLDAGDKRLVPVEGSTEKRFFKDYTRFKTLTVGDVTVNNPALLIMPDTAAQAYRKQHHNKTDTDPIYGSQLQRTEIILGLDVLTRLHLYIAYGERTLYVTAAGAGRPAAAAATTGAPAH